MRVIRPPKQTPFSLPDKNSIISFKNSPMLNALSVIPSLDGTVEKKSHVMNDILLSLVWNNPIFEDIPEMGSSSNGTTTSQNEGLQGDDLDAVDETSLECGSIPLMHPASPEMLVIPSQELHARNASSLYKAAIYSNLRRDLFLKK